MRETNPPTQEPQRASQPTTKTVSRRRRLFMDHNLKAKTAHTNQPHTHIKSKYTCITLAVCPPRLGCKHERERSAFRRAAKSVHKTHRKKSTHTHVHTVLQFKQRNISLIGVSTHKRVGIQTPAAVHVIRICFTSRVPPFTSLIFLPAVDTGNNLGSRFMGGTRRSFVTTRHVHPSLAATVAEILLRMPTPLCKQKQNR